MGHFHFVSKQKGPHSCTAIESSFPSCLSNHLFHYLYMYAYMYACMYSSYNTKNNTISCLYKTQDEISL